MQDIIQKIIEIDHMAQKLTDETIELRKQSEASIENDKKKMRDEYISKARSRIAKNTEVEEAFLKNSLEEIAAKKVEMEARLKQIREDNHDKWVTEIYNRVLGR